MIIHSDSDATIGILRIIDGIKTKEQAETIKVSLGNLPGVLGVEIIGFAVKIRFDPQIVTPEQFYVAIKTAGFKANGLQTAA